MPPSLRAVLTSSPAPCHVRSAQPASISPPICGIEVLRARRRPTKGPLVRPTAACTFRPPTASQQPRKVALNNSTSPDRADLARCWPGAFRPLPAPGAAALGAQPLRLSRSSSHAGLPGRKGRCRDAGQVSSPARPPQRAGCCGRWSAAGARAGGRCLYGKAALVQRLWLCCAVVWLSSSFPAA